MLYLLEINLSDQKSVYFALNRFYGMGKKKSFVICKKLGFSLNLKIKNLSQLQIFKILQLIDSLSIFLNNDLRKFKSLITTKLVRIKSYRGLRLLKGLPVRGQRTHTNANSAKSHKFFPNLYE